MVYSFLNFEPV